LRRCEGCGEDERNGSKVHDHRRDEAQDWGICGDGAMLGFVEHVY
jgi:hypothetical protein